MQPAAQPEPNRVPLPFPAAASLAAESVLGLYDAHQRELYSFLLATTRDSAAAEDLLQESFLRLLRETRADRMPLNGRAWLYRVAANLALSRGRHLRAAVRWQLRQSNDGTSASPEDEFMRREQNEQLVNGLGDLPDAARVGLVMAAHGFTGVEIAVALGRSESATRSLLCRSRLRLRELLAEKEVSR